MDPEKWKSVVIPVPMYEELKVIAHLEGRTLSGQLRIIYQMWKDKHLSRRDIEVVQVAIEQGLTGEEAKDLIVQRNVAERARTKS